MRALATFALVFVVACASATTIHTEPVGAEVYIDGERWLTPETADRMVVNLAEGHHHIEIHKAGYDSFSTEVDVRRGQTTPLNVSLPERGQ